MVFFKKKKKDIASKVVSKESKTLQAPSSLKAKRRNYTIVEQQLGPKKADIQVGQRPLHIGLELVSNDGKRLEGDLVVKYSVTNLEKYFQNLHSWENSYSELEKNLGYEINAEMAPYSQKHTKTEIIEGLVEFQAEFQDKMGVTFTEMGMRPYKIFIKWCSASPVIEESYKKTVENTVDSKLEEKLSGVNGELSSLNQQASDRKQYLENLENRVKQSNSNYLVIENGVQNNSSKIEELEMKYSNLWGILEQIINQQKQTINTSDSASFAEYIRAEGMDIVSKEPAKYNSGGKGPQFIKVFETKCVEAYNTETQPEKLLGEKINTIKKEAYREIFGGA